MPFLIPLGAAIATGVGATGTAATIIGGLSTIGIGAGLAFGAKSLLSGLLPGAATPTAPQAPAAATSSAAEVQKQADITAQKNKLELARRKRTGTTLTSKQGLLSTEESSQKTLLGG